MADGIPAGGAGKVGNSITTNFRKAPGTQALIDKAKAMGAAPRGQCTITQPYGQPQPEVRAARTPGAQTQAQPEGAAPSGNCKIKDGKVSCDGGTGFERKAEGELGGTEGNTDRVETHLGKGEAKIKGDVGKDGFSGSVGVKGTAAEATIKSEGNGAKTSATVTAITAGAKAEVEVGPKKVGASACAEAEIVKGTVKGSAPIPGTGYNVTAEASAGAGGAACYEAKVGKDGVKIGATVGLGPVLGGSIGVEPKEK